jgi:hypothetical protein
MHYYPWSHVGDFPSGPINSQEAQISPNSPFKRPQPRRNWENPRKKWGSPESPLPLGEAPGKKVNAQANNDAVPSQWNLPIGSNTLRNDLVFQNGEKSPRKWGGPVGSNTLRGVLEDAPSQSCIDHHSIRTNFLRNPQVQSVQSKPIPDDNVHAKIPPMSLAPLAASPRDSDSNKRTKEEKSSAGEKRRKWGYQHSNPHLVAEQSPRTKIDLLKEGAELKGNGNSEELSTNEIFKVNNPINKAKRNVHFKPKVAEKCKTDQLFIAQKTEDQDMALMYDAMTRLMSSEKSKKPLTPFHDAKPKVHRLRPISPPVPALQNQLERQNSLHEHKPGESSLNRWIP